MAYVSNELYDTEFVTVCKIVGVIIFALCFEELEMFQPLLQSTDASFDRLNDINFVLTIDTVSLHVKAEIV